MLYRLLGELRLHKTLTYFDYTKHQYSNTLTITIIQGLTNLYLRNG